MFLLKKQKKQKSPYKGKTKAKHPSLIIFFCHALKKSKNGQLFPNPTVHYPKYQSNHVAEITSEVEEEILIHSGK